MSLGGDDDGAPQQVARTDNSPWSGQQSYLTKGFERAEDLLQGDKPQFFPNATYVPFSNQTETALQAQEQRAMSGSPINAAAKNQLMSTLGGSYMPSSAGLGGQPSQGSAPMPGGPLPVGGEEYDSGLSISGTSGGGGNPAYDAMVQRAIRPMADQYNQTVMPSISQRFESAGRSNSGIAETAARKAAADTFMRGIGDVSASLAYPTYEAERGRQFQAAALAPQLAQTDYQDIAQLGQVGAMREGKGIEQLQDQMSRFNFEQNVDAQKLRDYMTAVAGGQFGGSSSTTAPISRGNPWLTGLGAAGTTAGIAGSLFGQGGVFPGFKFS